MQTIYLHRKPLRGPESPKRQDAIADFSDAVEGIRARIYRNTSRSDWTWVM